MNDGEQRFSALLHSGTPEPPATITAADIGHLVHNRGRARRHAISRWSGPLLAAAAILAIAVATFAIYGLNGDPREAVGDISSSAPSPSTSPPPAPKPVTHAPTPTPSPTVRRKPPAPIRTTPTSPPPSSTHNEAGTAPCATGGLRLTSGRTDGAAGSRYTTFSLTNTTAHPCTMQGFPGVALLDSGNRIVGLPAERSGPTGPPIVVPAARPATFIVQDNVATQTGCTVPRASTQVQVYPPNQRVPIRIPFPTVSCTLTVTAVTL